MYTNFSTEENNKLDDVIRRLENLNPPYKQYKYNTVNPNDYTHYNNINNFNPNDNNINNFNPNDYNFSIDNPNDYTNITEDDNNTPHINFIGCTSMHENHNNFVQHDIPSVTHFVVTPSVTYCNWSIEERKEKLTEIGRYNMSVIKKDIFNCLKDTPLNQNISIVSCNSDKEYKLLLDARILSNDNPIFTEDQLKSLVVNLVTDRLLQRFPWLENLSHNDINIILSFHDNIRDNIIESSDNTILNSINNINGNNINGNAVKPFLNWNNPKNNIIEVVKDDLPKIDLNSFPAISSVNIKPKKTNFYNPELNSNKVTYNIATPNNEVTKYSKEPILCKSVFSKKTICNDKNCKFAHDIYQINTVIENENNENDKDDDTKNLQDDDGFVKYTNNKSLNKLNVKVLDINDVENDFKEDAKKYIYTKLCISVENNIKCKYGNKCNFAHSLDELVVNNCRFGDRCNNKYVCKFKHPLESKEKYITRLKKNKIEY